MRNNTEAELIAAEERYKKRAYMGAIAVVVGLIVEVALAYAFHHGKTWLENWAPVFADALVAFGVWCEVHFGRKESDAQKELGRISDEKIANANERAAKADLARVELEAKLRPRDLTKAQFDELQMLRGKTSVVLITTPQDFEATRYASQIGLALQHAGIDVKVAPQRLGQIWTELYIVIPDPIPPYSQIPLYDTFAKAGFSVGCGPRSTVPMGDLPVDIPVIMVGTKKPLAGDVPPFMAGIGAPEPPPENA